MLPHRSKLCVFSLLRLDKIIRKCPIPRVSRDEVVLFIADLSTPREPLSQYLATSIVAVPHLSSPNDSFHQTYTQPHRGTSVLLFDIVPDSSYPRTTPPVYALSPSSPSMKHRGIFVIGQSCHDQHHCSAPRSRLRLHRCMACMCAPSLRTK